MMEDNVISIDRHPKFKRVATQAELFEETMHRTAELLAQDEQAEHETETEETSS